MRVINSLIFSLALQLSTSISLQAEEINQTLILSADINKTKVLQNLTEIEMLFQNNKEAKYLKEKYNIKSQLVTYDIYYTITISPIKTVVSKKSFILLLKPYFDDIFVINNNLDDSNQIKEKNNDSQSYREVKQTTLAEESLAKIDEQKIHHYLTQAYKWLDKWHALVVITLLGIFFYYRRVRQFTEIKSMQEELTEEQHRVEIKIKDIKG